MKNIIILMLAVLLDLIFGDPYHIPHPITYIGKMIRLIEKGIRKTKMPLRLGGFLLMLSSVSTVWVVITGLLYMANLLHPVAKDLVTIYLLYTSLAAKCLRVEIMKVYKALKNNQLLEARKYISYLVGRDTSSLNSDEVTRAAVETVAENTVDGVLAPLLYIVIGMFFQLPVQFVFAYKTVNTLDSMVGYIQEPYKEIGFFSAKTDDVLNYIPARIGSLVMVLGGSIRGYHLKNGLKILIRDRRNHKSPNCAYPEAAVAGLLGVQIGGTNQYFNETVEKPTIGDELIPLGFIHILDTVKIMYAAEAIMICASILTLSILLK
ncbi:MAG: cobalamin biosynthesis protein CobD [Firmicutes bacterium HGW-Firmicutes-1]|jgi:adenosylcobinamide-phosphate synthase|nr:MAG: cobalamin biosynthesis protein CobD [Firmicutes bacterium HGW-Firmicutes-1]